METWKIKYSDYIPEHELLREALCTLGNGYFATRGAAEESSDSKNHYPGTYLAGGYNRLETEIAGKVLENEDLVNWPDWTLLKFMPEGGEWFSLDRVNILYYEQVLDLKQGTLERIIIFEDEEQRKTKLVTRRIVSMGSMHLASIQWELTPQNWSGKVIVYSSLDGSVINNGVERYKELNSKHLKVLEKGNFEEDCIFLKVMTNQSELIMAQTARTTIHFDLYDSYITRRTIAEDECIAHEIVFEAEVNKTLTIEKIVAIYTSKDKAISEPLIEAKKEVKRVMNFAEIKKEHIQAWKELWEQCDIVLEADKDEDQLLLRLHIFHLFQTYSLNTIDWDAGIPARGWHGEAYRGHILWDELFIFPFLNISIPEIARSLLMYRYRRLPEAHYAAKESGYQGAMFPWQSGSNGREESQVIHLNPASGRWVHDNTHLQRHVNSAIAFNIWKYFQTSGDLEFLSFHGAEMLLGIAKFWASKVTYSDERKRYEIHQVVGPDEYHTQYPGSDQIGLKNNAYTNVMAAWTLIHAHRAMGKLDSKRRDEIKMKLNINEEEIIRWQKISHNMYVPFIQNGKIIEQFEGFEQLKDLDWEKYHEKYGEMLRLDRILEKEGDDVNKFKAVKQADVLMLFYLFSAEELKELFEHMGYDFDPKEQILVNVEYYEKISSHGSTLSKLVYSWVFARLHREKSWHHFKTALVSDFKDVQGGTTPEGIHLGAMAGTVDLIQRCYTGMEFRKEGLYFNPQLPENIKHIKFRLRYRDHCLEVKLTKKNLFLKSHGGWEDEIRIILEGEEFQMKKGEERVFNYTKHPV
ncbi:MAG: glycoside hydrolase family 65 protein [Bacteroidota bacterium]|nr:glycoside hydrolase family 65 protein [Bacteroidota bacterium]